MIYISLKVSLRELHEDIWEWGVFESAHQNQAQRRQQDRKRKTCCKKLLLSQEG